MRGSKLRDRVPSKKVSNLAAVPASPGPRRATRGRPPASPVARTPEGASNRLRVGSAREALALITAPLASGDGWRHLWLGDTGMGKSQSMMRQLIAVPGQLVLVHDVKSARPEFPELRYFRNPAEMLATPIDQVQSLSAAAFRGDPYAGIVCTAEEVADVALRCARRRIPVRLVFDELGKAVSDSGRSLESPSLLTGFCEGRAMGLSIAVGIQNPQRIPGIVIDQLSSVGILRCGPRALNYLDERLLFDREMLDAVAGLQLFECVLHRPGFPWDRTIYRFPPPRP